MERSPVIPQPQPALQGMVPSGDAALGLVVDGPADLSDADRAVALRMLNEALSMEMMCAQRCRYQALLARDLDVAAVADELERHAVDAQSHVQRLQQRIVELNGEPFVSTEHLAYLSHSEYVGGVTLTDMLKESLATERMAVAGYREMVGYLGEKDPVTRNLLEDIMAMEAVQVENLTIQLAAR